MIDRPSVKVSVILERIAVESRWEDHQWRIAGVVPDVGGEPRDIVMHESLRQRIFPGFELVLYKDEAEGYFLNSGSDDPSVFISLRKDEATGEPYPFMATLSYNEAARRMDGGEQVERTSAWPDLAAWLSEYVAANYKPEPKRRQKPRSFKGKEGRLRGTNE
ncbi:hypothetical protein DSM104443_02677 [Usitatibacter rugosus]|uniref:DUF3305 domain-containing protein n=1 Tax=Usitatibacter rugosus TaxID=2732067 RepID=A0A6M4GXJ9_9PROT|nr:DUF3305 domain-containing protein [Usitatibacter rugosus]QJR11598.1 hypothetical protein DSM104443_02677 [Usitatibacter rugosus]